MKKQNLFFSLSILTSIVLVFLIIFLDPLTSNVLLLEDKGAFWYFWKLPKRDNLTMIIVWSLFIFHFLINIFFIKKRLKENSREFNKTNLLLLLTNFIFILLHLIQTILFYDGLAQDVPIFTSQYSVILLLVLLLVMLMPKRGLFFSFKIKLPNKALKFLYSIHGILFLFAIVYTFWFHPMVYTIGHLIGFFYIFLLMIQVSFIKTSIHLNKLWILSLEILVAFHGASVAFFVQQSSIWPMFLFGFLFIFFATQIYSLNLNKYIRTSIQILFFVISFIFYFNFNLKLIHQILWIPIIEYLIAILIIFSLKLYFKKN